MACQIIIHILMYSAIPLTLECEIVTNKDFYMCRHVAPSTILKKIF